MIFILELTCFVEISVLAATRYKSEAGTLQDSEIVKVYMRFWQKELKMGDNDMIFELFTIFTNVREEKVANFRKGCTVI